MSTEKIYANHLNGKSSAPEKTEFLAKFNPHTGLEMGQVPLSREKEIEAAVGGAVEAFRVWPEMTPVARGGILQKAAALMRERSAELASVVAVETGKPPQDAEGEVNAGIAQAEFFAGEGMRLYGRSLTSGMKGKYSHTVRMPRGIAALIVPANTPVANIAWKIFPALICGNTAVLKSSEDAPGIAIMMADILADAGLPAGAFNVVQGDAVTGKILVSHRDISLVSFTGSTSAGRWIAENAGKRLLRVSLELGGKNPFVVLDDADLEKAVHWAALSAFSNAGQRCAAASRIIVQKGIAASFTEKLAEKAASLKLGVERDCHLGPVINLASLQRMEKIIQGAVNAGSKILTGGKRAGNSGYYFQPTLITEPSEEMRKTEIFGPVAAIQIADDFAEALHAANDTEYGLTSAIHTGSMEKAMRFAHGVRAGVANINLGTFGSEPHMPFGGFGLSGNGTREPGTEALDVYSELKNISYLV